MSYILLFSFSAGISLGITFLNIPPALALLQELYRASYTGMSILMSALLWSHAALQIPAGILIDRLTVASALRIGLVLMTVGNLIPATAPEIGLAIGGRVLTGIGTGITFISVLKLIALNASPQKAGSYQSFFVAFFSAGSILAYLAIPKLVSFGWQWVHLLPAAGCVVLFAMWFGLPRPPRPARAEAPVSLRLVFRTRVGWALGGYHALSYGSFLALGSWLPSMIAEAHVEATAAQLTMGGVLVMLMGGLGRLCGGFVLLRVSALQVANLSLLALALLFSLLFLVHQSLALLILALTAAWVACVNFGALFQLAASAVEARALGSFFGFVNFIANLGAVLFTMLFGLAKDVTGAFFWGFGAMALFAALAFMFGRRILIAECGRSSCRAPGEA
jgi:MFS transporter, NNP family, nitrate/nitrite transporter